jgi:protein involved in polysaccharide export with SLBB domain
MLLLMLALLGATDGQAPAADDMRSQRAATEQTQVIEGIIEPVDRGLYVLGAGDVLTISFQGGCNSYMLASGVVPMSVVTVSSDGMVPISGVGQVELGGQTIADAEETASRMAREHFPDAVLSLSLVQPRSLRVTARGMVNTPGTYVMSSVLRVSDLVERAGGLSIYGSRIGVMRTAEGDSLDVNLMFDPGTMERISDPYLTNNAVVIFPLLEDPVYLVRRGRYLDIRLNRVSPVETWDLPDSTTGLAEFLDYTGGLFGDVDLSRSALIRGDSVMSVWSPGEGIRDRLLRPGDTLSLVMISDSVVVSGAVAAPGPVPYVPGWNVREYVALTGGFEAEANEGEVKVVREGGVTAEGSDALEYLPLPGDVIEVPFSWTAKHAQTIGILSTTVGIISIVYNLLDRD